MTSNEYICQACGTVFLSRQQLDQHNQREHIALENDRWTISQQAEDDITCPICGAQFATADQVNRHTQQDHQR